MICKECREMRPDCIMSKMPPRETCSLLSSVSITATTQQQVWVQTDYQLINSQGFSFLSINSGEASRSGGTHFTKWHNEKWPAQWQDTSAMEYKFWFINTSVIFAGITGHTGGNTGCGANTGWTGNPGMAGNPDIAGKLCWGKTACVGQAPLSTYAGWVGNWKLSSEKALLQLSGFVFCSL